VRVRFTTYEFPDRAWEATGSSRTTEIVLPEGEDL
jgi:hypothetical protein